MPIPDPIVLNHSEDGPKPKKTKLDNSTDDGASATGTKVMILPSGPIHCNKPICDILRIVKPYILQLLEDSNLVIYPKVF